MALVQCCSWLFSILSDASMLVDSDRSVAHASPIQASPFSPSIRDTNNHAAANKHRSPPHTDMLISLTVGKVDAGVAVLLTEDKRLVSPQEHTMFILCALTSY